MLLLLAFRSVRQLGGVRVVLLMLLCVVVALAVASLALAAPAAQTEPPIPPAPDPLPPLPSLTEPPRFVPQCAAVTEISSLECDTLVYFYTQMNGPNWRNNTGWLTTNTPCTWYGISCGLIDSQLRVTGIDLSSAQILGSGPGNNLTGDLPPQIGYLDALISLNLSHNTITHVLPDSIGYLTELEELVLTGISGPSGSIPAHIGYLTKLRILVLYGYGFVGIIPTQIGYLTSLVTLELWNTFLSGNLPPQIGHLADLVDFRINGSSRINGSIPPEYANLRKLSLLDFTEATLTGPFPSWVGDLPALTTLHLTGNSFTGLYPTGLRDRNLVILELSPTDLEQQIPTWFHEIESLQRLHLEASSTRQYVGPFPAYLGDMDQLTHLTVIGNRLEGNAPTSLWVLPNLLSLSIEDSSLRLTLPVSIDMPQLRNLTLIGANFTGSAATLGEVTTIRALEIRNTGFTGYLGWLMNLNELVTAGLDDNQISGPLPAGWADLPFLSFLSAKGNQLTGIIPPDFADAPALQYVDLSYNALEATDPDVLSFIEDFNPGWQATQTVPPDDVTVSEAHATGATLTWDAPDYVADAGFYQITATPRSTFHSGCPDEVVVQTSLFDGKGAETFQVTNLCPKTTYDFQLQTITLPNNHNPNRLESSPSDPAAGETAITSVVLVAATLDHPTMTLKFDPLMQTLQTAVAANPDQLYVVLTDRFETEDDSGETAIYVLAGDEPLKINGLPNPATGQLDPTLTEYDMGNSGVLTEGADGNDLGAFIRWARMTYAPTFDIPYSFSFIGHGVPLAPTAPNLFCYFTVATRPNGQDVCHEDNRRLDWTHDGPWLTTLPTQQDINPDWTDATSQTLISPYTLAQALEMGTAHGLRPLTILDIVHCFAGTVEEFYEVSRSSTSGAPLAHVIIGSPNYTYFGPELALEALLAVDFGQDAAATATDITAAYDRMLTEADLYDEDSGADGIVNGTDDVEHPRLIIAVDNRAGQLQAIKNAIDTLSELLYQKLDEYTTYGDTFDKISRANAAAGHYDTTLCTPQDWRMNAEDGLADLYLLMTALEAEFAADPEIAAAARAVAEAVDPVDPVDGDAAIISGALRRVDGTPWYAVPPSPWTFGDARGLAIYADFLGRPDDVAANRLLGWQAYWYTALPFEATLPHHSNPHPLTFNARQSNGHTWADVLQAFWARYPGDVGAWACTAPLPEIRARYQYYVPVAVAPFQSPFSGR